MSTYKAKSPQGWINEFMNSDNGGGGGGNGSGGDDDGDNFVDDKVALHTILKPNDKDITSHR